MSSGIIDEEWRSIIGYVNYQVSNLGRVRNTKTTRLLTANISSGGYVKLSKEGVGTNHLVHRLVANAFASPDDQEKINIPPILANQNRASQRKRYGYSCRLV